jgi:hypothetical protein
MACAVFDIPLYTYLAAKLSDLLHIDGLVAARIINIICWLGCCFFSLSLLKKFDNGYYSALLFIVFEARL